MRGGAEGCRCRWAGARRYFGARKQ